MQAAAERVRAVRERAAARAASPLTPPRLPFAMACTAALGFPCTVCPRHLRGDAHAAFREVPTSLAAQLGQPHRWLHCWLYSSLHSSLRSSMRSWMRR